MFCTYNNHHNGYFIIDGSFLTCLDVLHLLNIEGTELKKILNQFNYDIYAPWDDNVKYIRFKTKEDAQNFIIILKMVR